MKVHVRTHCTVELISGQYHSYYPNLEFFFFLSLQFDFQTNCFKNYTGYSLDPDKLKPSEFLQHNSTRSEVTVQYK